MRLDYYHTGDAKQELFSVDRVVIEPLPWPGDLSKTIDDTNLGKYFFEVRDQKSKRVLYSRGFASIYGEWETTDEAKSIMRTFSESLRFPAPDAPVEIALKKRDAKNNWRDMWSTTIDPKRHVHRSFQARRARAFDPDSKDGRPGDESRSASAWRWLHQGPKRRSSKPTRAGSPRCCFRLRLSKSTGPISMCGDFVRPLLSRESRGRRPVSIATRSRLTMRSVLSGTCSFDNRALRKVAQFAPYEFVEILANNRTYGGGGIFNLYSTVAVDNAFANYVFVHEFGHHFAGLADEYYTSSVAYAPATERVEPWEPNATALLDPANLKWKDLVSPDTPIPTPWNKEEFEKYSLEIQKRRAEIRKQKLPESVMEALFREELQHEQAMFRKEKY